MGGNDRKLHTRVSCYTEASSQGQRQRQGHEGLREGCECSSLSSLLIAVQCAPSVGRRVAVMGLHAGGKSASKGKVVGGLKGKGKGSL
eukprot:543948-Amphidinium_carterae.1